MVLTARQIVESYWSAEIARDLDAVLSHYDPEATFIAPGWNARGWAAIRKYYEDSAHRFPGLEVEILSEVVCGDSSAFEWAAILIDAQGGRHPLRGINRVTMRAGKFFVVNAYFDPADLITTE